MAGFKTHISTSTGLGVVYGAAGVLLGLPFDSCLVAGGLCSVSGMLPDIDSDSGVPLRETMAFTAAVIPMMMVGRFEQMGMTREAMAVATMIIYLFVRFVVAKAIKKYTVHRGMWHSLPAAAIVFLLAFLVASGTNDIRVYKAGGVLAGFLSHLILDELWSIEWQGARLKFKKSFGTALKFWGKSTWANFSVYGKLIALLLIVFVGEPQLMKQFAPPPLPGPTPYPDGYYYTNQTPVDPNQGSYPENFQGNYQNPPGYNNGPVYNNNPGYNGPVYSYPQPYQPQYGTPPNYAPQSGQQQNGYNPLYQPERVGDAVRIPDAAYDSRLR